MSIERTIAEAIAKNPDLAGVSFPDLYGSTALALRAFWDCLAPSLDHNNATLDDLGVCESCEEINVVSSYGELRLCPGCVADESKCAESPTGKECAESPTGKHELAPGVEPEDAACVYCEPKAEPAPTPEPEHLRHPLNRRQVIEPAPAPQGTLGVWHNGYDWVVATSAEDARDVACALSGERIEDYDAGDWEFCAPGSTVTIRGEDGAPGETRTCAEWVARNGRGFLCSTEA